MQKTNRTKKARNLVSNKPGSHPIKTFGPVTDFESHLPEEWWSQLFSSLYLKTDGDIVENDLNTKVDVDLIIEATGIKKNDELLDVCCGQGRHSLEFARRGYKFIEGVDYSKYLIKLACNRRNKQNLKVKFSQADARNMDIASNSKDCIFLMGDSFGYFEHEEDDMMLLQCLHRILKANGQLVLDIVDGEWIAKNFEKRSWEWIDKQYFVNRERTLISTANGKRIISREIIINSKVGVVADQFYAGRIYSFDEIAKKITSLGFGDVKNFATVKSESSRGEDLGMMAQRLFITATAFKK